MADRKLLGAWYTPADLVATVVDAVVTAEFVAARTRGTRPLRVLDPACGDGRFLRAVDARVRELGCSTELTGIDIDATAALATRTVLPHATVVEADALTLLQFGSDYDLVIGNPPFLSQMATATTRGGASSRGGGLYGDVAAEFLALAGDVVDPLGGRVALVLPQSMLSSRDTASVRRSIDARSTMFWSWWSPDRIFDAQVHVCALAFEFEPRQASASLPRRSSVAGQWSHVVTSRRGVPDIPEELERDGTLGDRARLNANFRDEYYGMVPAVGDHASGPKLVSSALIDPGRTLWGQRTVTFAKQHFERPRLDVDRLDPTMQTWARRRLVPKVLVANQTRIVEAVCDPDGEWLPAVPVIGVYPVGAHWDDTPTTQVDRQALAVSAWEIAAVLTSPLASLWCWHTGAGTGLSADTVRLSPVVLATLPWPVDGLDGAVRCLRSGDVRGCATATMTAYRLDDATVSTMAQWWTPLLERIEARQPPPHS